MTTDLQSRLRRYGTTIDNATTDHIAFQLLNPEPALDLADVEVDIVAEFAPGQLSQTRRHGQGHGMLAAAASLLVVATGMTALMLRGDDVRTAPATSSAGQPVPAINLTDAQRSDAVQRCSGDLADVSTVVDGRPGGVLVGAVNADTWRTCVFMTTEAGGLFPASGPTIAKVDSGPTSQLSGPSSLIPATSSARPIAVIDAKPPAPSANHDPRIVWVWGRVDTSIATIVVSTPTANYTPTITDGLFATWWPGNDGDQTVVRGFDANGVEIASADQLNCAPSGPVVVPGYGLFTAMHPRLVVNGSYVEGGCRGAEGSFDASKNQSLAG